MIDLGQIDQINLDKLTRKYELLDKRTANYLAKLGYYKALEINGGPEKAKLGDRLEKKKSKSLQGIEVQLEKKIGSASAENFVKHLEKVVELGESENVLGKPDKMIDEANRYASNVDFDNKIARKNMVIFAELVSFGYRYRAEGGVPDSNDGEKRGRNSASKRKARKRAQAAEKRRHGVKAFIGDMLGF